MGGPPAAGGPRAARNPRAVGASAATPRRFIRFMDRYSESVGLGFEGKGKK